LAGGVDIWQNRQRELITMSDQSVRRGKPLPDWLVILGSVLVAGHLLVVAVHALAAPSGPWPLPYDDRNSPSTGPVFASKVEDYTWRWYLKPLHFAHNYHFETNHPEVRGVRFEVRLRDRQGKPITTLWFPDDDANFWARHRQTLLAQNLLFNLRVESGSGELIPPPGLDRIPPTPAVCLPSDWSLLAARSYQRFLCRQYHAASAQLICHIRGPVLAGHLFTAERTPSYVFEELQCNFGDYRHEQ
jgi:hypothetical protein